MAGQTGVAQFEDHGLGPFTRESSITLTSPAPTSASGMITCPDSFS